MMFLNPILLVGLAAMAIPILVHLINRRRAELVHWGAMRFLTDSLSARRRRILLEEIMLMILRCLAVGLLAAAMARPYMPAASIIPWQVIVPALLLAAVAAGVATALWSAPRPRNILLILAALLVVGAVVASVLESRLQTARWSAGTDASVVIAIDGSTSMMLSSEAGRDNFQRAVAETCEIIRRCRPSDMVTVVLAAESTRPVGDVSSRLAGAAGKDLQVSLEALKPPGGSLNVLRVLQGAGDVLAQEHAAAQRIVLLTDTQAVGWEAGDAQRWRVLGAMLAGDEHRQRPKIICRRFPIPQSVDNLGVTGVRAARQIIVADRPVEFEATVFNSGAREVGGAWLTLSLEGRDLDTKPVPRLAAGETATVRFSHAFAKPGAYLVRASLTRKDMIAGDDAACYLVRVLEKMPVLIIQDVRPGEGLEGPGDLLALALAPQTKTQADQETKGSLPIEPKVISISDAVTMSHFSYYRMVVLADVARMPSSMASALADYVSGGGGLWVLPGVRTDQKFYNEWKSATDEPVLPATLARRLVDLKNPPRPAVRTFDHPGLAWTGRVPRCDAGKALIYAWWELDAGKGDKPGVSIGAKMDNGMPLLVQRSLGKGRVLLWGISLQAGQTTWPALPGFVPTVHELAYEVASASGADANVPCGSQLSLELPSLPSAADKAPPSIGRVPVTTPSGRRLEALTLQTGRGLILKLAVADEPGVYTFTLPKEIAALYEMPSPGSSEVRAVAIGSPRESVLTPLKSDELKAIQGVDLLEVASAEDLYRAVTGEVPGQELWRLLVLVALVLLVAEIAMSRWITRSRRSHTAAKVEFAADAIDLQKFRTETGAGSAGRKVQVQA